MSIRGNQCAFVSLCDTDKYGMCLVFPRGDIPGALDIALSDAPYGPNVDEAKVRSTVLFVAYIVYLTS